MKDFEVKIVLGHSFGDEGKGVTVQHLCKEAIDKGKKPLVIRFSGGPQAAHTIKYNGIEHICSTYGSGVLLGVPTLIWNTAYFDPISAKNEYDVLKEKMDEVPPLYVMPNTKVITPYEVHFGRINEKILKDGTCGRGIYPTFKREKDGLNINVEDLTLISNLVSLESYYYSGNYDASKLSPEGKMFEELRNNILENKYDFYSVTSGGLVLSMFDVLIFEGSQGLLLDMDRGYYPNVTPSKVGLNAFTEDKFLEKALYGAEVYLVTRTYLTRHGNGYTPSKRCFNFDLSNKFETNVLNEYQGEFKTGLLNFDLLNEALNRHCIDNFIFLYDLKVNLVITHWDLLKDLKEFNYIEDKRIKTIKIQDNDFTDVLELFKWYSTKSYVHIRDLYLNDTTESNLKKCVDNC